MNSEDAEARIALHVYLDTLIDLLDAPDEAGVIWRDDTPYDVEDVFTEGKVLAETTEPADDDSAWLIAVLVGTGVGLLVMLTVWLILLWSVYAAMGMILWLMANSVP